MNLIQIIEKYKQLKTIKATAKFFNIHPETLRQNFIKNNFQYKKRIVYSCNENIFELNNQESFYWAGFIAADGNVSKQNDVSISLKLADIDHLYKFKNFIKSDTIISEHINKSRNVLIGDKIYHVKNTEYARVRIRNNKIANDLIKFNIIPNKTKTYDIPNEILNNVLIKDFIRGYFDGDGWFSTNIKTGIVRLGFCGNLSVMNKIKSILVTNCKLIGKPYLIKQGSIYKLTFNHQYDVKNIINYMYKNSLIHLDRKYKTSRIAINRKLNGKYFDKIDLEKSYNQYKSYKEMSKQFDCAISTICKYMIKYKINQK